MPENEAHRDHQKNMTFLQHAEDMRWHVIRMLIAIVIGMVGMFLVMDWLIQSVILAPLQPDFPMHKLMCSIRESFCFQKLDVSFQATSPTEQFTKAILIAVVGGFIVAFPYIIWELWRFIKPALGPKEAKNARWSVFVVSILFLIGVCFAYFIILPFTFRFLAEFQLDERIQNIWRIGEVVGLVVQFSLAGGLLFELPILVYVLSRMGILRPKLMRKYRRHAVIVTLMLAGVLTPSPDILSQILLALPILLLYELSIGISARVERKRQKERAAEEAQYV